MDDQDDDDNPNKEESIKVVLIGNSGVGKTCISQRYINNTFTGKESSTVGASYFQKNLVIDGKKLLLDIWDTAGQEKYRSMGKMFYKDAYIVIFIYDITDRESFLELKNVWYEELKSAGEKYTVIAVVGNKNDMFLNEQVSEDEGREWANEIGAIFGLVSAKTGDCINALFDSVIRKYLTPSFTAQINKERKRNFSKLLGNKEEKKKSKALFFC